MLATSSSKIEHPKRGTNRGNRKTHPEMPSASSSNNSGGKKSPKSRFPALKVDTTNNTKNDHNHSSSNTPATTTSTDSNFSHANKVRTRKDVRSPGAKATPRGAVSPEDPAAVPDFITQTDKHGNSTTPRSAPPKEAEIITTEDDPFDACLESLRLMCCCLLDGQGPVGDTYTDHRQKAGPTTSGPGTSGKRGMLLPMDPNDPNRVKLLPQLREQDEGKKCLVLDLDETLVHSSFRAVPGADFVIPVQIEDVVHFVYVAKRPGVDEFLLEMAKYYEIVVYTASLNKYADPLLDLLDPHRVIRTRLFRESCVYYEGNYVKDLSLIDRDLSQSIIVDNSPNSYLFHPDNAIDCSSFIDDPADRELIQIGGFLKNIHDAEDVRGICSLWKKYPEVDLTNIERLPSTKNNTSKR